MKRILPMIAAAATTAAWAQLQPPATPGAPTPTPPPAALPPGVIAVPQQPAALPPDAVAAQTQPEAPPPGTKWIGQITANKVNARGRDTVFSHRVFPFERGERVFVLEEITKAKIKAGDVKQWVRVQVPGNVVLWVHSKFIDQKTLTVTASSLRVRSGYGENYPILGELPRGARVIIPNPAPAKKGSWMGIVAPANTSVYIAARYVARAADVATTVAPKVPLTPDGTINKVVPGAFPPRTIPLVNPNPVAVKPGGAIPPTRKLPSDIIVVVPNEAFNPNRKDGGTPESFPAPPLPVKRSLPAGVKNPALDPRKQPGATPAKPGENNKVVTPPAQPGENTKPGEPAKTIETVEPPAPIKPAEPAEPAEPATPEENKKPAATAGGDDIKNKVADQAAKPEAKPEPKEKPPIRIVTREGVVQRTLAIQAPSPYVLEHIETGKVINYLLLDNPKLPLKLLRGRTVLVSGEEAIDPRWLHTPVLRIKTLKTLDDTQP